MGISHHAFSLRFIQFPMCVLVFDQFLSCCGSDPLGSEALFEPHSWLKVIDIHVVSNKMMHGWSFGLGEFPRKALLFCYFCLFLFDWGWKETGSVFSEAKNLSPSPPPGDPSFAPISCQMFFLIFLHTFSHSTSEALLCVLGGLVVFDDVIFVCIFC